MAHFQAISGDDDDWTKELRGARKLTSAEALGKFLGSQPVSMTKSYDAIQPQPEGEQPGALTVFARRAAKKLKYSSSPIGHLP